MGKVKGMSTWKLDIVGVNTILMHNPQTADPLNPFKKELSKVTSKRTKTDEDYMKISKIEFISGCYWDDVLGLYLPANNLEQCIIEGAKINKNGKKAPLAIRIISDSKMKLNTDAKGKSLEEICKEDNGKYQDNRFVIINRSRIMKTRPRFDRWNMTCTIQLDETLMTVEEFQDAISNAGARKGLGTYRPKYGLFTAKLEQLS